MISSIIYIICQCKSNNTIIIIIIICCVHSDILWESITHNRVYLLLLFLTIVLINTLTHPKTTVTVINLSFVCSSNFRGILLLSFVYHIWVYSVAGRDKWLVHLCLVF